MLLHHLINITTELVLVQHILPIPIPPRNAGIGPILIQMPELDFTTVGVVVDHYFDLYCNNKLLTKLYPIIFILHLII